MFGWTYWCTAKLTNISVTMKQLRVKHEDADIHSQKILTRYSAASITPANILQRSFTLYAYT
jgi:hypothetical protein